MEIRTLSDASSRASGGLSVWVCVTYFRPRTSYGDAGDRYFARRGQKQRTPTPRRSCLKLHLSGKRKDTEAARPGDQACIVWMTPAEFAKWRRCARVVLRIRGEGLTPGDALSLQPGQMSRRSSGSAAVRKAEAFACAHVLQGFGMPVLAGDVEAFSTWFYSRFRTVEKAAHMISIDSGVLRARLRGFELRSGARLSRKPEAYLIRALDWVDRFGSRCPYGNGGVE